MYKQIGSYKGQIQALSKLKIHDLNQTGVQNYFLKRKILLLYGIWNLSYGTFISTYTIGEIMSSILTRGKLYSIQDYTINLSVTCGRLVITFPSRIKISVTI